MPKKLITVAWSTTVEVEIPTRLGNPGVDELEAIDSPKEIQDLASEAVKAASNQLNWKNGVITDVQDCE
jgi:hypothetical protein